MFFLILRSFLIISVSLLLSCSSSVTDGPNIVYDFLDPVRGVKLNIENINALVQKYEVNGGDTVSTIFTLDTISMINTLDFFDAENDRTVNNFRITIPINFTDDYGFENNGNAVIYLSNLMQKVDSARVRLNRYKAVGIEATEEIIDIRIASPILNQRLEQNINGATYRSNLAFQRVMKLDYLRKQYINASSYSAIRYISQGSISENALVLFGVYVNN